MINQLIIIYEKITMQNLGEVEIDETPRFDLDSNDIDPSPRWIFIIFMLGISKYFTRSELHFLQHLI